MRTWIYGTGVWRVTKAEFERLWKAADWDTRQLNDQRRADAEWAKLYEKKRN
jgi:hypothetical protein